MDSNILFTILEQLSEYYPIFLMSMTNPDKLPKEILKPGIDIFWLTDLRTDKKTLNPTRLDFEIFRELHRFVNREEESIVIIDRIEQLLLINGFNKMSYFFTILTKLFRKHSSIMMACIQTQAFQREKRLGLIEMFENARYIEDFSGHHTKQILGVPEVLEKNYTYLFYDDKPTESFRFITELDRSISVLCLTTSYPEKLMDRYGIDHGTMYWLTERSKGKNAIHPSRLDFELTATIIDFVRTNENGIVLLDGLHFLVINNNFERVMLFLKHISDTVSIYDFSFVVPINPAAFEAHELNLLKSFFDWIVQVGG